MTDDLPDAPLVRRVAVLRTFVVDAFQQCQGFRQLRPKDGPNVAAVRHLIDVGEVVLGSFGAIGDCEHPTTLLPGRTTHYAPRTLFPAMTTVIPAVNRRRYGRRDGRPRASPRYRALESSGQVSDRMPRRDRCRPLRSTDR